MYRSLLLFVFFSLKKVEFVNNKLRHKTRILGHIRAGRPAAIKESMINQINDAWTAIVGERCHLIGLDEINPENIAEDGIIMPAAGKEAEWLAKNLKTFEERAEKGEETSQDLLADFKAMQSKA
jgi:hypothetical protein